MFAVLVVMHAFDANRVQQVAEWFAPSIALLLSQVPLLFAPPLVQLPLALAPLPPTVVLKMLAVLIAGSFFGLMATGIAVQSLWGAAAAEAHPPPAAAAPPSHARRAAQAAETTAHTANDRRKRTCSDDSLLTLGRGWVPASVLGSAGLCAGVAACVCGAVLWAVSPCPGAPGTECVRQSVSRRMHSALLLAVSVASVRVCEGIPRPFAQVVPNIISSSALTSVGVQILGLCHGQAPLQSLQAYRTGTGGVFGGTGAGDWIFSLAPAVIVALGFTSLSLSLSHSLTLSLSPLACVCARACACV